MVADLLSQLCHWLVIEFVPKADKKVKDLLATREDIFPNYTQDCFELEFKKVFEIKSLQTIKNSERTLYLMRRK